MICVSGVVCVCLLPADHQALCTVDPKGHDSDSDLFIDMPTRQNSRSSIEQASEEE